MHLYLRRGIVCKISQRCHGQTKNNPQAAMLYSYFAPTLLKRLATCYYYYFCYYYQCSHMPATALCNHGGTETVSTHERELLFCPLVAQSGRPIEADFSVLLAKSRSQGQHILQRCSFECCESQTCYPSLTEAGEHQVCLQGSVVHLRLLVICRCLSLC